MDNDRKSKSFSVAKDGGLDKHRAKNPGAKPDADEPWISNYPPLQGWLNDNDARCDWQMRFGKRKEGFMLEQWRLPGSLPFIVLVYTRGMGWEIFTPNASVSIDDTLADTKERIFRKQTIKAGG